MKKILLILISFIFINQTTYSQEVAIGTQIWTTSNLNVSTYNDGTPIPQVSNRTAWAGLTTGAWCYYEDITANGTTYGKLYNWYAVAGIHDTDPNTPNKSLAPTGYHIPSDSEWTTLTNYLSGPAIAGGTMKSTGTTLWASPNTNATNSSGFTGLPGGLRDSFGVFYNITSHGYWWTLSELNSLSGYSYSLSYLNGLAYWNGHTKTYGFSVRLINNNSLSNATFNSSILKLYPNPVLNILNVNIESNLINEPYNIFDCLGRVVINGKFNDVDTTINVEQLSKGIYYLKVSGNSVNKFIKE